MFDIRIESAPNALRLMQHCWPTCIISLVGDDLRFELPQKGPHHFIARFHDVERPTDGTSLPKWRRCAPRWNMRGTSTTVPGC